MVKTVKHQPSQTSLVASNIQIQLKYLWNEQNLFHTFVTVVYFNSLSTNIIILEYDSTQTDTNFIINHLVYINLPTAVECGRAEQSTG